MSPEFVDESPDDDLLDAGTELRIPRRLIGWLVAAAVALAGAVIVNRNDATPARSAEASRPAPLTTSRSTPVAALDETFTALYESASDTARAHDIRRTGTDATSCKGVRVGSSPQQAAGTELTRTLRGYTLLDSSRIIDEGAGLCALQIRAHDASGTVAVIMVSSPPAGPGSRRREALESHSAPFDGLVLEYARFTTPDGWTIVVGTSGPAGKQPPEVALGELATSTALRW